VRRAEAEAEPAHGAAAKPGGVAAAAEGRAPRSDSTLTRKSSWRAQVAAAAASTRKWKPYGGRSSSIKQVSVREVRQESGVRTHGFLSVAGIEHPADVTGKGRRSLHWLPEKGLFHK